MIRMHFPDPADSPTGAAEVRLRYGMRQRDGRTVPVLMYRSDGSRACEVTRQGFAAHSRSGVSITVDTERERHIVREALGIDVS